MSLLWNPLDQFRQSVQASVNKTLHGKREPLLGYDQPPGDPGLLGPRSAAWRVHSDFPSLLAGGISALLLQTLHPLAMAGVAQHSDYRRDPLGRLQRTGAFIAMTTFGGTAMAHDAVAMVQRIHKRVHGFASDGRPYSANDPELLTWVHSAEVGSFLRGYQRYSLQPLSERDCNRYLRETSKVAELLGATGVPKNTAQLRNYFRRMRPELRATPEALDAVDFLRTPPSKAPEEAAAYVLFFQAAVGLLPSWAREMLGLEHSQVTELAFTRPAATAVFAALRWALGPSPLLEVATRRATARRPRGRRREPAVESTRRHPAAARTRKTAARARRKPSRERAAAIDVAQAS